MPAVMSIVVPVYRIKELYLRQCIESLCNQSLSEIEMILIDDGSPDEAGRICDEYALKDKRIRVFHCNNSGVSASRNRGVSYSTCDLVTFLDGDDWVEPCFCQLLYESYCKEKADVVVCGYRYCFKDSYRTVGSVFHEDTCIVDSRKSQEYLIWALYLQSYTRVSISNDFHASVSVWAKLYRKEFLEKNQILFHTGISLCEDNLFIFELYQSNPKVSYVYEALYNYRITTTSVTQRRRTAKEDRENLLKIMEAGRELKQSRRLSTAEYELLGLFYLMHLKEILQSYYNSGAAVKFTEKSKTVRDLLKEPYIVEEMKLLLSTRASRMTRIDKVFCLLVYRNTPNLILGLCFMKKIRKKIRTRCHKDSKNEVRFE